MRQVSPTAHFCTCAQHTNAILPSLPQTSSLVMASQSACADRVAQQCCTCAQRACGIHCFSLGANVQSGAPPFTSRVSRAPHLNVISAEPTHRSSQFRHARARVSVQTSPPADQCCCCPLLFLLAYCLSYPHTCTLKTDVNPSRS